MSNLDQRWSSASAMLGGVVWLLLLGIPTPGGLSPEAAEKLFLLAPLVIVPLGLGLAGRPSPSGERQRACRIARFLQPFGAAMAVASFWLPAGRKGAALAAGWLFITVLAGLSGLAGLLRSRLTPMEENCFNAGLLYLPVGGAWLILSRLGSSPMGFKEPIVLLTAVHFHFSGFAAPVLAGATGKSLSGFTSFRRTLFTVTALGVIAAPAMVAAGFVLAPVLKVLGAFLLTASLVVLAILVFGLLHRVPQKLARRLLAASASSVIAGMILACVYAVSDFAGRELISIPQMALFHGTINGLGFALCGLLGWTLVFPEGLGGSQLQTSQPVAEK